MAKPAFDIERLTTDERLDLLEELWESLREDPDALPLTPDQRAELDRRIDDVERNGSSGIPWHDVLARIENANT